MLHSLRGTLVQIPSTASARSLATSGILLILSGCVAGFNRDASSLPGSATTSSNSSSPQIQNSTATVLEGAGNVNLVFNISPALTQDGELTITAAATSTAVAGVDYNFGFANPVSVSAGDTSVSVSITVLNNAAADGDRQLDLNLELTVPGETTSVVGTYSLTITDDEQPHSLAFVVQPTNRTAGQTFASDLQVEILDHNGARATSATNTITLAIANNPGSGTLSGTASVAAVAGVATFPGLSINRTGTGYTLSATATGLTSATSNSFNVSHGAATQLAFSQGPSNASGATVISPAITVHVLDAQGNLVTSDNATQVSLSIANNAGPGGTLSGTVSNVTVSNGVATFNDVSIDKAGIGYTLTASDGGALSDPTSAAFNITVGAPTQLAFNQQPTNAASRTDISPSITVRILDAGGNLTSSTASVTLAISNNPSSGTLYGTTTRAAVGGVATFNDIQIDKVGTGYTLEATSGSLTLATSNAFNITVGSAAQLAFNQQPSNADSRSNISPSITVRILDAGGNLTASTDNVTLAISNNPASGSLFGTATRAAVAGTATFNDIQIDKVGTGYTLAATSGTLTSATSSSFDISVGSPSQLAFQQQPSNAASRTSISPSITVRILDAGGNLTSSVANVTLAISNNPAAGSLFGTATRAAVSGTATFNDIQIDKAGAGYTLEATSGVLTAATSNGFDITVGSAAALAFVQQPTDAVEGATISPSITVKAVDAGGNTVTTYATNIAIAIDGSNNPGSGTLSGTATRAPASGVSTFDNLSINNAGAGYKLRASSGSLTEALSDAFTINSSCPATINGSVVARYTIAPNWNDYALTSNTANACNTAATNGFYESCIHGGESKKVELTGIADCAGLTLTETGGHFDWFCDDNGASDAYFYSVRLKSGKGLSDLLKTDGTGWANNSVTVTDTNGCTRLTTTSTAWWSNTVTDLTSSTDADAGSVALSNASRIYVITANKSVAGYNLNADKIAFVTLNGSTLSYNGATSSTHNFSAEHCTGCVQDSLIAAGSQNFLWFEGSYVGSHNINPTDYALFISGTKYSRFNRVRVKGGGYALHVGGGAGGAINSRFTDVSTSHATDVGVKIGDSSNYNRLENIHAFASKVGVEIYNSYGNRLFNLRTFNILSGGNASIVLVGADNATLVNVVAANSDKGILVGKSGTNDKTERATVHLSTSVNMASDAAMFVSEADYNTITQGLWGNNFYEPLGLTSAAYNKFSDLALAHGTENPIHTGVFSHGGNNDFVQRLWLGSGTCNVTASDNLTAACLHGPSKSTAPLSTSLSLNGLFNAMVSSDSTNPAPNAASTGVEAYNDLTTVPHWFMFDKFLRGWGKNDGNAFPHANHKGPCTSGNNCKIWDFSYASGSGHELLGVNGAFVSGAACPASADSVNTDAVMTDLKTGGVAAENSSANTYLINAYEIVGDLDSSGAMIGDDDGLCESNEYCVFAPNLGATNGRTPASLDIADTCTFTGGNGVTGVKLFGSVAD